MAPSPFWYKGPEATVLRTVGPQGSLFELLLPPGMRVLSGELADVDALLDDERFFGPFRPVRLDDAVAVSVPRAACQVRSRRNSTRLNAMTSSAAQGQLAGSRKWVCRLRWTSCPAVWWRRSW